MMTVKQLIEILEKYNGNKVAVCADEHGGWDNIEQVREDDGVVSIEFGGGSPFSDE
jgi:Fe-S cluster biogenesis protein NfuA